MVVVAPVALMVVVAPVVPLAPLGIVVPVASSRPSRSSPSPGEGRADRSRAIGVPAALVTARR